MSWTVNVYLTIVLFFICYSCICSFFLCYLLKFPILFNIKLIACDYIFFSVFYLCIKNWSQFHNNDQIIPNYLSHEWQLYCRQLFVHTFGSNVDWIYEMFTFILDLILKIKQLTSLTKECDANFLIYWKKYTQTESFNSINSRYSTDKFWRNIFSTKKLCKLYLL